jgi:hypothetical protein
MKLTTYFHLLLRIKECAPLPTCPVCFQEVVLRHRETLLFCDIMGTKVVNYEMRNGRMTVNSKSGGSWNYSPRLNFEPDASQKAVVFPFW